LRTWRPDREYDVATCIEVTQVLPHDDLLDLLRSLRFKVRRLIINISNKNSLHGAWVRIRRFQAPFIVNYTPKELLELLHGAGFRVVWQTGVGFVTPVSLLSNFELILIKPDTASLFEPLDRHFPMLCHLCLVEAMPVLGGQHRP